MIAVLPRLGIANTNTWTTPGRLVLLALVLAAAITLALLSEAYFEKPLRRLG